MVQGDAPVILVGRLVNDHFRKLANVAWSFSFHACKSSITAQAFQLGGNFKLRHYRQLQVRGAPLLHQDQEGHQENHYHGACRSRREPYSFLM